MPDTREIRDFLAKRVLNVTPQDFDLLALDIFRYQFAYNSIYQKYCSLLEKDVRNVLDVRDIPFLPITLFKSQDIYTNVWKPQVVFESSTTTGQIPSRHAIRDLDLYKKITRLGFTHVFKRDIPDYVWLALLPSYAERAFSSLVHMASSFVSEGKPGSQFVTMNNVRDILQQADQGENPVAMISVSFALLDLAEKYQLQLTNTMLIETGGMKGRRVEPTREELHEIITSRFGVSVVCSEYGMTELMSQAWSRGKGIFYPAPTLRVLIRDLDDPFSIITYKTRGGINCIDLANLDTCAFIATDDIGIKNDDGSFEVLGRFDTSELRGCNLMVGNV